MKLGLAEGPLAWVVCQAANSAPKNLSARLEEEWLAGLSELEGPLLQLRFALGCCWAALAMRGSKFNIGADKSARHTFQEPPFPRPPAALRFPFTKRRDRMLEDAYTWLERLRRGLTVDQGTQLRTWLKRRSHRACIARLAAQKDRPEDLAVLSEIFQISPDWVLPRPGRTRTVNATFALMALSLAALPMFYVHYAYPGLILGPAVEGTFAEAQGTTYSSGQATLRQVVLPDGTRVVLNRGTRILTLYSEHLRSVELVRGEATFTVPPQLRRSFDITVGNRRFDTEASTFNVRQDGTGAIELTVLQGTVTLPIASAPALAIPTPASLREGSPAPVRTTLAAHQELDVRQGTQSTRTLSQLETQARIAWHRR